MLQRTDKPESWSYAGYAFITKNSGSAKYCEDQYESENADWQLRISVEPTEENLNKAAFVLKDFFNAYQEVPSLEVKCFILPSEDKSSEDKKRDWDPVFLTGNDRNQRGREICIYIGQKIKAENKFVKTAEEWKQLMLSLWKALQDANVLIGYAITPSGDKAVPAEPGLLTPFSYTSFKPYAQRHRILHQTEYNPIGFDDPLDNMKPITWSDIQKAGINSEIVKTEMENRIKNAEHHILGMYRAICNSFVDIEEMGDDESNGIVIDPKAQIVDPSAACALGAEEARLEIEQMKKDFAEPEISAYLSTIVHDSQLEQKIPGYIDKAPNEMQKLYRGLVHVQQEEAMLEQNKKHLEPTLCSFFWLVIDYIAENPISTLGIAILILGGIAAISVGTCGAGVLFSLGTGCVLSIFGAASTTAGLGLSFLGFFSSNIPDACEPSTYDNVDYELAFNPEYALYALPFI